MRRTTTPINIRFARRGVHVFESHHAPGFSMRSRAWDYHKLCLIERGATRLITPEGAVDLAPGRVIYLPAGGEHRFEDRPGEPVSLLMACFYPSLLAGNATWSATVGRFGDYFPAGEPFDLRNAYRQTGVINAFRLMLFEQTRGAIGDEAMIASQLVAVMVMLIRARTERLPGQAPTEAGFAASLALLHEEFHRPIGIDELAALAHVSYRTYTTRFKKHTGQTVGQYVNGLRIAYAKERMLASGNVMHAALQSGFNDLAHFYRAFKRTTGMTPKAFLADGRNSGPYAEC